MFSFNIGVYNVALIAPRWEVTKLERVVAVGNDGREPRC